MRTNENPGLLLLALFSMSLLVLLPLVGAAQVPESTVVMGQAEKSLGGYVQSVVNDKNFAKFGFKSLGEVRNSQLGIPYPVIIVGLKDLKSYNTGAALKLSASDAQILWYPVQIGGETRTKLEMIRKGNQWITGEFGGTTSVQAVASAQAALPGLLKTKNVPAGYKVAIVRAPALYAQFLLIDSSAGQFMVPATTNPQRFGLQNKTVYTVDEVFTHLKAVAVEIDEQKVM